MLVRLDTRGHSVIEADKLAGLDAAVEAFEKACGDAGLTLKVDIQAIPQTDDENKQVMERHLAQEAKTQAKEKEAAEKFQKERDQREKAPGAPEHAHPSTANPQPQPREHPETHDRPRR